MDIFSTEIILENEAVRLEPLSQNHYQSLLPFALNEPEIWNFSLYSAAGKNQLKNYIAQSLEEKENKFGYAFAIFDKKSNQYAGSTRYYDIQLVHKTVQVGYTWIGSAFQGSKLNKNCKYLLLNYAFENLEMLRVEFRADVKNTKSILAMKSIGCKEEGILRNHLFKPDGSRRDSIVLSILKSEWESEVKSALFRKINAI